MNKVIIEFILSEKFQVFLNKNYQENIPNLILKNPFPNIPNTIFGDQILGKKLAKSKFPSFFTRTDIIYPPHLNLEQSTAETVAKYRKSLFPEMFKSFADFTAGFGVDAFWMSHNADQSLLLEPNETLCSILKLNAKSLFGKKVISIVNDTLENYFNTYFSDEIFDVALIDPSRRDGFHQKSYEIEDLSPNVIELLPHIKKRCKKLICKFSPMMNLSESVSKLEFVTEVHLISYKNELKEICVILDFDQLNQDFLCTAHEIFPPSRLSTKLRTLDFTHSKKYETREYSEIKEYVYIPNSSVLKAIQYFQPKLLEQFDIHKIHPNTHLFTSSTPQNNFPGRVFKVEKIEGRIILKQEYSQIISKNYGMTPEEIVKKFKLKIKGSKSLIFTQDINSYAILEAIEIKR